MEITAAVVKEQGSEFELAKVIANIPFLQKILLFP
jgi:hypothetical protein